jgi:hypothetical protein
LKLCFSLDLEYVLPLSKTIGFHSFDLFVPYPFQKKFMVHHYPNEPFQNHLELNLENDSYGVWHEMKPLSLLPKNKKYYLQKESKYIATHHLLHLILDFFLVVHLFSSLELYSLSSEVLSSHNSNTISFPVWIWIFPS